MTEESDATPAGRDTHRISAAGKAYRIVELPRRDPSRCVLVASGELDLAAVPRLEEAMMRAQKPGVQVVELDVSDVAFLSCAPLEVLLRSQRSLASAGATLLLTGTSANREVARILSLTGLDTTFSPTDRHRISPEVP